MDRFFRVAGRLAAAFATLILAPGTGFGQTPGVYVQEKSAVIEQVATSVPAFLGFTEKAGRKVRNKPVRITSMRDFERMFGGRHSGAVAVDVVESGKSVDVTLASSAVPERYLHYAVELYFANGGGPCYVVSIGEFDDGFSTRRFIDGLKALETTDEVTLIVIPEMVAGNASQAGDITDAALAHAKKLGDRFVIIDVWNGQRGGVEDIGAVNTVFRSEVTNQTDERRFGAAYYPYLNSSIPLSYDESMVTIASYTSSDGAVIRAGTPVTDRSVRRDRKHIYRAIVDELDQTRVRLPASAAVAGAYVKTDNARGVWKAPANVSLSRIDGTAVNIDSGFNDALNVDGSTGKSVNAIRNISGKGILVWGARTLDGNSSEYRYVPVRRLANMIEESVDKGISWVVFEPNEAETWNKIRASVEDFMSGLFRDGAFEGRSAKEAYFVSVGLGQTMTANDISNGRVIVEIGFAPLRPAEFVVLRIEKKVN
jgi:phage tail sheath protein FI